MSKRFFFKSPAVAKIAYYNIYWGLTFHSCQYLTAFWKKLQSQQVMQHKACQGPSWHEDACLSFWRLWFWFVVALKKKKSAKKLNFFAKDGEQFPTQPRFKTGSRDPQAFFNSWVKMITRLPKLEYTAAPCHTGSGTQAGLEHNSLEFHPLLHTGETLLLCTEYLQGSNIKKDTCEQHFSEHCLPVLLWHSLRSAFFIPLCSAAPRTHLNQGAKSMFLLFSTHSLSNVFKDMSWHVLRNHQPLGENTKQKI